MYNILIEYACSIPCKKRFSAKKYNVRHVLLGNKLTSKCILTFNKLLKVYGGSMNTLSVY